MNKKGFTLVELLAVIALLAILMGIAVPNIMSTINNKKRDTFLMDAERMVAKAKYLISVNKYDRNKVNNGETITYSFSQLNEKKEFDQDADGGEYNNSTYVKVSLVNNNYRYCVYIIGSKRNIKDNDDCISSDRLTGIDVVLEN